MGCNNNAIYEKASDRRRFIEGAAGTIIGAGLAGCAGGGSNTPTQGSGDTTPAARTNGDRDLAGVKVPYWSFLAGETRTTRQTMQKWVKDFNRETGIQIQMNVPPNVNENPGKYQSVFENGDYPVIFDSSPTGLSRWLSDTPNPYFEPLGNWVKDIDDELYNQTKKFIPMIENASKGYDIGDPNCYDYPLAYTPFTPMVARRDHFEEAGLDPRNDFPPQNYDDFLSVCRTLKQESPGNMTYPTGLFGASGDVFDSGIPLWTTVMGGDRGRILNDDWSGVQMNNDVWQEWARKYTEVLTKHNLSTPNAPAFSDETMLKNIAAGTMSIGWIEMSNAVTLKTQAPDLWKNNQIMWGSMWSESGAFGDLSPISMFLTKKPDKHDKASWDRKQQGAIKFIEWLISPEKQSQFYNTLSRFPINKQAVSQLTGSKDKDDLVPTAVRIANSTNYVWAAKYTSQIKFTIAPPIAQKMLQGNITPEEACQQWTKQANQYINDQQ